MGSAGFLLPESKAPQYVPNSLEGSPVCHKSGTRRDDYLNKHFPIAADLAAEYRRVLTKQNAEAALSRLSEIDTLLTCGDLNLSSNNTELREYADNLANQVRDAASSESHLLAFAKAKRLIEKHDIDTPDTADLYSIINRALDPIWWFRKFKHKRNTRLEQIQRDLGAINKQKSLYCSRFNASEKAFQDNLNKTILESRILKNSHGQSYSVAELAAKTTANPEIRRAELMVRLKGFEEVADLRGDSADFITLTTSSRMHAYLHNGKLNPEYDGTTPKQASNYLCNQWAKIRAELAKKRIQCYGFRVAEPHHDGTPHHHYLLFTPKSDREELLNIFSRYAFQDSPNEKGARKHRLKVESIDKNKGGATSYIAKYISKSIDGYGVGNDLHNLNSNDSSHQIRTWASTWRIRQFQQVGGPPVTVWRELRKLNEGFGFLTGNAWYAADSSNWAAFVLAMGGPTVKRKDLPIKPEYGFLDSVDTETGEEIRTRHNRYGEVIRPPVSGLRISHSNIVIPTKINRWHESKSLMALEPVERSSSSKEDGWSAGSSVYQSISKQVFNLIRFGTSTSNEHSLQCAASGANAHAGLGLV
ncbi:MAG: replication endonuclease [Oceanospirillaceae bacterium]|nr:replication endonuclease [Oceanospirillaceae bacterium]